MAQNNPRYFWIKLYKDFYQSGRIRLMRKLENGDTLLHIYIELQLESLDNEGYIKIYGVCDSIAEELAFKISEKVEDVQRALDYLQSVDLLKISEDGTEVYLTFLENLIGSEAASTVRSQRFREKQKNNESVALQQNCNTNATPMQQNCNANATPMQQNCNANATPTQQNCNANATPTQQESNANATLMQQESNESATPTQQNATKLQQRDRDRDRDRDIYNIGACAREGGQAVSPSPSKKFKQPTIDEVRAYCLERNNKVDPEQFVDFYTSKGWKVGKEPMKDWKAAVRTWEKRDERSSPAQPKQLNKKPAGENRKHDFAALERQWARR